MPLVSRGSVPYKCNAWFHPQEETLESDWRESVARYYDLAPHHPRDIPFYSRLLDTPRSSVLELGCGTGRVTLPLAERGAFVHGVDNSSAMLEVCRKRLAESGDVGQRVRLSCMDITALDGVEMAGGPFDLVIAPFRVLQNLATDHEVAGLFSGIKGHLARDGRAVLNVFNPNRDRDALIAEWPSEAEQLAWEVEDEGTVVRCYDRRVRVQRSPLVLFPELVYRRFADERLLDEAILRIAMRCYYPDDLVALVEAAGFAVAGLWGGYDGEAWGIGSELVIMFGHR